MQHSTNKEYCDIFYSELEKEKRKRDEAGDHWLGGVTSDEFVDADKELDLGYKALCEYNGGEGDNVDCKFDDDEKEEKYQKKHSRLIMV